MIFKKIIKNLKIKDYIYLPRFIREYNLFKKTGHITHIWPILNDYRDHAGTANGHYFHQDLLVASFIYQKQPIRHIDIGSRIDGFVAHVASFRKIEIIDVRPLPSCGHENITFFQNDFMQPQDKFKAITDSISCLHAIEHFGLGRYNDTIDPMGHIKGFHNLLHLLQPNGYLYISFPISSQNEVHFNAHRTFHPKEIFNWIPSSSHLTLKRFDFVNDKGHLYQNISLEEIPTTLNFGCGIYSFQKL